MASSSRNDKRVQWLLGSKKNQADRANVKGQIAETCLTKQTLSTLGYQETRPELMTTR